MALSMNWGVLYRLQAMVAGIYLASGLSCVCGLLGPCIDFINFLGPKGSKWPMLEISGSNNHTCHTSNLKYVVLALLRVYVNVASCFSSKDFLVCATELGS